MVYFLSFFHYVLHIYMIVYYVISCICIYIYVYNSYIYICLWLLGLLEAGMRSQCQLEKREGEKELCPDLSVWSG